MNLVELLSSAKLTGGAFSRADSDRLRRALGDLVPDWFCELCERKNLSGMEFSLAEERDLSSFGVELRWLGADDLLMEATELYPGIVAKSKGYFPFGACLEGSGDPYFLDANPNEEAARVVRIPHDAVIGNNLDEKRIEVVAENLQCFFERVEHFL